MIKKRTAKGPPNPYLTTASPDDLEPANRIAFDIVHVRRDLLPSVERIMNAGLDDDATLQAIVKGAQRTRVRVEVELHDSPERGGYEFHVTAFVSAEGRTLGETDELVAAAHDRCPISRLLQGAATVGIRAEDWAS